MFKRNANEFNGIPFIQRAVNSLFSFNMNSMLCLDMHRLDLVRNFVMLPIILCVNFSVNVYSFCCFSKLCICYFKVYRFPLIPHTVNTYFDIDSFLSMRTCKILSVIRFQQPIECSAWSEGFDFKSSKTDKSHNFVRVS